jgi:glycerol-3-phosphate dehydrogenase
VRRLSEAGAPPIIAPSQGVHIVLDRAFLGGDAALMIPRTPDGRVLFAIPWHDRALIGTTETPLAEAVAEPCPLDREIEFLLATAGRHLARKPARGDVRSAFAGIRPLVKSGATKDTAALARDHTIEIDRAGLLTIAGGKWTTYRKMAEDCIDRGIALANLPTRPCITARLRIHGGDAESMQIEAKALHAARHEMARTVEDVLARRTRMLFLDAEAAIRAAPRIAALLAHELGHDAAWQAGQLHAFERASRRFLHGDREQR